MTKQITILVLLGLVLPFGALAPDASAGEPCCNVTAIDARSSVVSAREMVTGRTIQFKLDDPTLVGSIKVGQVVEADFKTLKVTVRPSGVTPCCAISAVDARSGVVTLKENGTGRPFELTVKDSMVLGTLKVGQTVDANVSAGTIAVAPTGMIVK
jgi:hypothetical protein